MVHVVKIKKLNKSFVLHNQDAVEIPVFKNFSANISKGEAVAVSGSSGAGKSSLLKLIYGTYRAASGGIEVKHRGKWVDLVAAAPHQIMDVRHNTIGFVTQFLRCIPRVPAELVVAEPLLERGFNYDKAVERARELLQRLHIPERLWHISPTTFSGGEQQRVNIARGFAARFPVLLLDEPTASLDKKNRNRVFDLIEEEREAGTTMIAVFHDPKERKHFADREIALS